jgi:hypothetical protein
VDFAVAPATVVALNPQQGTAPSGLRSGDVVDAQVVQSAGNAAKIAIGNTVIEVLTQVALTPGSTVKLAVSNSPQGLRLSLVGNGANAGNAGAAGNAGSAIDRAGAGIASGPGTTRATVTLPASAGVTTSAAGTAPQLAPAASESAPVATPSTPAVITGSSANAAGGTPLNVSAAAATADPQLQVPTSPPNPAMVATAALAAAVQSSAARQGGLGPLFADAGIAASVAAIPEPVRQAAERLLALQSPLDETVSAADVKKALDRSGLFLEARLSAAADGGPASGGAASAGPADDLKAALVVLRNVIKNWLATDLPDLTAPEASPPQADAVDGRAAPAPGGAAQAASARTPPAAANTPPPPYRGAPIAGQAAALPSISADTAPRDIGKVLLGETDAALARQTLLQAASLPDSSTASGATARHDPSGPRWLFEVPFATPQGAAVAQFEISRDGHKAPAPGTQVPWRARFSLNVEPIGPVHAQIALTGTRAAVTLWAERPETSTKLRDNAPSLADALRRADLDSGDVLVRGGTPPRSREAVGSGHFVDRAT